MPDKFNNTILGVIADTHIPDRAWKLPSGLLDRLKAEGVDQILHAGDASNWKVIRTLEKVAPVTVVQGNRDWFLGMHSTKQATLDVNSIKISIAHGHRSMGHYLVDKWAYLREGYRFQRYHDHLSTDFPDSDIIIFGHTHNQTATWVGGQLFFNPGAAYPCKYNHYIPQFGVISITPQGFVRTVFRELN
ncbi:MAG: metallophosphoesterase family protein [Brevefilum sp.]